MSRKRVAPEWKPDEKAARLAPKNAQVIATGAILEFLAGYVVKAEQMAQAAVNLDDKNGRAHAALALSGLRVPTIGTDEELAKALKLAPKDPHCPYRCRRYSFAQVGVRSG